MEKKIAIRGHETRGEDVIKALEDMGGENLAGWKGHDQMGAYYINDEGSIVGRSLEHPPVNESYSLYTLEELEALQQNLKGEGTNKTEIGMKFKVGDRVKLKSKEGLDELKRQIEGLRIHPDAYKYAGSEQTILECNEGHYRFDVSSVLWHECLFEGLVEDTDERLLESAADACKKVDEMMEARYQKDKTYYDGEQWSTEFECPDGYIFKDENGNVINATKIVLEKKKKEYPKSYKECCKVMNYCCNPDVKTLHKEELIRKFQFLILYRDAYWKIAGDEMGLGKSWKPDYDSGVDKFGIICLDGVVQESNPTTDWERHLNKILDFPTREMRDAFYENFKEEIEICKELL